MIALATCRPLPEADEDESPLADALVRAGVDAHLVAWHDRDVDWTNFRAVLLRSTWDYHHHLQDFLSWIDNTTRVTPVFNPARLVRWNAHKGYLLDLQARGIPIVPTTVVSRAALTEPTNEREARDRIDEALSQADRIVIKPAWSAGSYATRVLARADRDVAVVHLREHGRARDMLIQPFMPAVNDVGERCLVFFAGEFSHAVRKHARFAGEDEQTTLVTARPDERAAAEGVLRALPEQPLYARVDLIRSALGTPILMELELIEPSLFLRHDPRALDRFVSSVKQHVA